MQEADKKMTMIFLKLHKGHFISTHVLRLGNTLLHLVHVNSGIICICYNTQKKDIAIHNHVQCVSLIIAHIATHEIAMHAWREF